MKVTRLLPVALLALGLAVPATAEVKTYNIDGAHSEVSFRVKHMVTWVRGQFDTYEGTIVMDTEDPTKSSVTFTIDATSINTFNENRDKHLRSADFFDVEKFPKATFTSTSVRRQGGDNRYIVVGDFTLRGVTQQLSLPVEFAGEAKDPWGNTKAGFSTETTINRKDYGIVWNKNLDEGGVVLGDEVQISINLEAVLAKPEAQ